MKTKIICAAIVTATYLPTATAQAYTSFGTPDCGQWLNSQRVSDRGWLLGYMTGQASMYHALVGNADPLESINSADQIYVWMKNYCQKYPLKKLTEGGRELFTELLKTK